MDWIFELWERLMTRITGKTSLERLREAYERIPPVATHYIRKPRLRLVKG
ncbi:hypothetical protein H1164_15640 [Thermoactinomyces daqus]|uniref:Uncharacterized protein n=1 Tax=Thermoactinomyces daqus TaxID=1329516 RepID=A0A7W1XCU1_9BACL|nr:hypothetical protein [Thermoactinomyces daqus]MBA4544285.1 hypothetical protein [Thermoactinomyces daqus]